MDEWFGIENDNMVPTWLFGATRRTPKTNPVEKNNMFPSWLSQYNKDESEASSSKDKKKMVEAANAKTQTEQRSNAEETLETKDGRLAEFNLYYYPHSFYCQKVRVGNKTV